MPRTNPHVSAFDPSTWGEDERLYFYHVDRYWEMEKNEPFRNGRPLHAVYLIHKFLDNAKCEIRLFSGSLLRHVRDGQDAGMPIYAEPKVLDAATRLLSRVNGRIEIVVEDGVDAEAGKVENHPLVQAVQELKDQGRMKGRFEIRQANKGQVQQLRDEGRYCHMMIMDSQAYRLERDPANAKAFVNANDEERAVRLIMVFHRMLYLHARPLCQIRP